MGKEKNVFISHYHKNDPELQRLKLRFKEKGYQLKNSSIDSTKHRPKPPSNEAIERLLRLRIRWAGVFICLIGTRTHTREWVDYEIEQAQKQGKHIIGIYTHGANGCDLPQGFETNAYQLFGWNSIEKVIDHIENHTMYPWENPDSSPSPSLYQVNTVSC